MQDTVTINVKGHVLIKDKSTGEVLRDVYNAVHFGNLASVIAQALAANDFSHIRFMAFGSGGTSINPSGQVLYKSPNTGLIQDPTADLYNRTYEKNVSVATTANNVVAIPGTSNFADIVVTATLDFGEPAGQLVIDNSTNTEGVDDEYVFDEIALFSSGGAMTDAETRMLTHVIFHPVQKALNRVIEVVYTLRVQMS